MPTRSQELQRTGFTLIEILIVIALIAILATIVIVAINPGRQLGQGRNAKRHADVNTVLNAVYQYAVDNNGNLPATIPTDIPTEICRTDATDCGGLVNLTVLTDNQKYLVAIPIDPSPSGLVVNSTGYTVSKSANGRVTVATPYAELGVVISVTR